MQGTEQLIEEAKRMAIRAHSLQTYAGGPYDKHPQDVVNILIEKGYTDYYYIISAWLHDTIEDTYITYGKIKQKFGEKIAEIVWCVTDEGKNRKEKHKKTPPKTRSNEDAIVVKLADRVANMRASIKHNNLDKLGMYLVEYKKFRENLHIKGHVLNMWSELDELYRDKDIIIKTILKNKK